MGQESTLQHLSLAHNVLEKVPQQSLQHLSKLALLDLGYNKLLSIPSDAFFNLKELFTLKLNDNNLQIDPNAFNGLENSLKNLNLKGKHE